MNNSTVENSSDPQLNEAVFEPEFLYPVAVVYISIAVVAAVGNSIVIFAILANKSLRENPTNLFLLSLAISDLITATLAMPFDIEFLFLHGIWKHGAFMCVSFMTAWLIAVPTSILTLLAISVDRFLSLKDPMRHYRRSQFMTRRMSLIVILIIWIYSIMWALLPLMGWRVKGREPVYKDVCIIPFTLLYSLLSSFLNFVGPLLLCCVFFILAFMIACRHQRNVPVLSTHGSRRHASREETKFFAKNLKATKTTLMFLAAFFFCWQPYTYFSVVNNLYGGKHWDPYPIKLYVSLLMLGYLNSALNPFLFAFRNEQFRSTGRKFIRSLKPAADPRKSSVRRPSAISAQSTSSVIPENESKEIRLQSIRQNPTTPEIPRKHGSQSS